VLYKLALTRYRRGRADLAIDPVRRALAMDERLAEAHYLLGVSLRAASRPDEAVAPLRRAVELQAAFSAAREELADLYGSLGRRRESLDQLEALAALEAARPERLVRVALAYARLGRQDSALVTLGRAAERHPGSPVVYTGLGRVWLDVAESTSDPAAVRKALEALRAVSQRPDATSETLTLYGRALLLSGNAAGAERMLEQAVERLPVEPMAFKYLADAASRLGHATIARNADARFSVLATQ
jgi:tetratricopeptide (TPR) repeat protein